jgi:flagellar M-ring protein FliF
VSKTLRHTIDPAGRVQKVAAAVLVDDFVDQPADAQAKPTRRKRTPEEMKQIEDLARAAVGFDAARGDVLSVQNVSFLATPQEEPASPPITDRVRTVIQNWLWLVRYAVLLTIFAVVYLFVLRPVKDQVVTSFKQLEQRAERSRLAAAPGAAGGEGAQDMTEEFSGAALEEQLKQTNSQVERVVKMKRHLSDRVRNDPIAASQLVRQWLQEAE